MGRKVNRVAVEPRKPRDIGVRPINTLEDQMHNSTIKKSKTKNKAKSPVAKIAGALEVWEDDPGTGVEAVLATRPDPGATPLPFRFPAPAPEPSNDTSSFAFR